MLSNLLTSCALLHNTPAGCRTLRVPTMGFRVFLFSFLLFLFSGCLAEDVTLTVQSVTNIATIDQNSVCATLDWWPPNKCDYDQCPWGKAGLLNLDLNNKILANSIKAFSPLRIRIGGSLQDQLSYRVGEENKRCPRFKKSKDGLFGFSEGCLTMKRWDEINKLLNKTGAVASFGLNALIGRQKPAQGVDYVGDWNSDNARDFIKYTVEKGYNIDSWELGNELCGGGVAAKVDAKQYAEDVISLKKLLNEEYQNSKIEPKLMAPGGFYDGEWFYTFLQAAGPNVVDVVTHHIYNLGPGKDPNLINKIQDPFFLDKTAQTYKDVETTVKSFPGSAAWVGEAGGAYNSGGKNVSNTFANSFWYLDQLGMTSTFNHKVFCRQSLVGGNYGLLNTSTFVPHPDYYSALLWHRLMGKNVLSTSHSGSNYFRAYSHCSKNQTGITLLLINMSNSTSFQVSVNNDLNLHPAEVSESGNAREEYHLTPKDGNIQSRVVLLNGSPLVLTDSSDIPALTPVHVDPSSPITVAPDSIVFASLTNFQAPACN